LGDFRNRLVLDLQPAKAMKVRDDDMLRRSRAASTC